MHEKVKNFKDYTPKVIRITGEPEGFVVPLSWYKESEQLSLVCIHCLFRWEMCIPYSMMNRPQWMGELVCAHPQCATKGYVVKG